MGIIKLPVPQQVLSQDFWTTNSVKPSKVGMSMLLLPKALQSDPARNRVSKGFSGSNIHKFYCVFLNMKKHHAFFFCWKHLWGFRNIEKRSPVLLKEKKRRFVWRETILWFFKHNFFVNKSLFLKSYLQWQDLVFQKRHCCNQTTADGNL